LGVQLHPQKTRIVHVRQGFEFLGYMIKRGRGQLRLAEETCGRYFDASKKDTAGIFAQIEKDLRNLYVVGFSPSEGDRDGKFHQLKIETPRAGVKIRARKGYIAGR
jgi:VWFA-related protein